MPKEQDVKSDSVKKNKCRKARFFICTSILLLALMSLLLLVIHPVSYWYFTILMAVLVSLLSTWLTWYLKYHYSEKFIKGLFRKQALHWLGVLAIVYLLTLLVNRGVISENEAGLFTLCVIALSLYLAGVYGDFSLFLVGITIGLMAAGTILIKNYLLLVMIPLTVLVILFQFIMLQKQKDVLVYDDTKEKV